MTAMDETAGSGEHGGGADPGRRSGGGREVDPRFDPAYQRGFGSGIDDASSAPRAADALRARPYREGAASISSPTVGAAKGADARPLTAPHQEAGRRAARPAPEPAHRPSPMPTQTSTPTPSQTSASASVPLPVTPLASPAAGAALRALWIAGTTLVVVAVVALVWSADPQLTFWTGDAPPAGYLWAQIATSTAPHILWVGLVTTIVAVAGTAARRSSVSAHPDGDDADDDDPFDDSF